MAHCAPAGVFNRLAEYLFLSTALLKLSRKLLTWKKEEEEKN